MHLDISENLHRHHVWDDSHARAILKNELHVLEQRFELSMRRLRRQFTSPIPSDNDDTHIAVVLNQLLVTVIALLILFGWVVGLVSERPAPLLISIGLLALLGALQAGD